jgi:hypothetical protein
MQGEFSPGLFSTLSADQLTFVRAFLRVRGNLSEMEKVLGVSYPTIRNKLEEINQALEHAEQEMQETARSARNPARRREPADSGGVADDARGTILRKVADGELDAAQALEQLKGLSLQDE